MLTLCHEVKTNVIIATRLNIKIVCIVIVHMMLVDSQQSASIFDAKYTKCT